MTNKGQNFLNVPLETVGPVKIVSPDFEDEICIPLATYETPLWPSVNRGASVSKLCGGIRAVIMDENMARSILLETTGVTRAAEIVSEIKEKKSLMEEVISGTSRFAKLKDLRFQIVGKLIYIRLSISSGDASGHNMVTKAADALMNWLIREIPDLNYVSVSANYCVDKKVSSINGILGRGKYVCAEIIIPEEVCLKTLKTSPRKVVDLNIRKNLIGSILGGGVRSANAHFANMLLAFYLATGQDAANIIEGSQGITHTEMQGSSLYFSVTLPNIIVGTVGNGKDLETVGENLKLLKCAGENEPGANSRKLAIITACVVLCGELSLMAAQTNPGELMKSHEKFEREKKWKSFQKGE